MQEANRGDFAQLVTGVMDVYGAKATQAGLSVWWGALQRFSLDAVRAAMSAHVQDPMAGKFAPKPADVIGKLQSMDGRPGAEEAWSMMPRTEAVTVVWTEEMSQAFGVALPLLNEGDAVAARMAFIEQYRGLVQSARDAGRPAKWMPSLGSDQHGREAALMSAVDRGRISAECVVGLLPVHSGSNPRLLALIGGGKLVSIRGGKPT